MATTKDLSRATPIIGQKAHEIQPYGHVVNMPIALGEKERRTSADNLNQLLADTITLRDLYKKHHWSVTGPTFYQLHLLFDKHAGEQTELIDAIAERIQTLGGVALAMAADVAETTSIPRPPARTRRSAGADLAIAASARDRIARSAAAWHVKPPTRATTARTTCSSAT